MLCSLSILETGNKKQPSDEADTMDEDEDPGKLKEKIQLKITELEAERQDAEDTFDDTTFIDNQINELKRFMYELDTGLEEALSGGTKRDRAQVDSVETTRATGAFVNKIGKSFNDFMNAGK